MPAVGLLCRHFIYAPFSAVYSNKHKRRHFITSCVFRFIRHSDSNSDVLVGNLDISLQSPKRSGIFFRYTTAVMYWFLRHMPLQLNFFSSWFYVMQNRVQRNQMEIQNSVKLRFPVSGFSLLLISCLKLWRIDNYKRPPLDS